MFIIDGCGNDKLLAAQSRNLLKKSKFSCTEDFAMAAEESGCSRLKAW